MSWVVGIDVGGTFTDFHALNMTTGDVRVHKTPSTPANPADAVIAGMRDLASLAGIAPHEVHRLSHGTTVATNALIQGKGGRVALIVTQGFRDLLEIGRQIRPHMFDLQKDYPAPLVPRERRLEVAERVAFDGSVVTPLEDDSLAGVIEAVRASGADALAVCLLFSFLNPDHERRLKQALSAALPDVHVSISSDVQPEFREYERLSTTVLNAYLQPVMQRYLGDFEREIARLAPEAIVGINQSAGGLMSPPQARHLPIRTALSGPAAGAVGAVDVARGAGCADFITLDMGGTSADVCLVRDYRADMTHERWIEGYPARVASVDINAVGAGGGSVAWFDRDGLIKVGPESAGADPGPACYGLGGDRPTVTDANLLLGRLSPAGLLGGGMALDSAAARRCLQPMAERLGMGVERAAHGLLGIVTANMVRAIRAISVERGHDPRDFALLPFGGAGPLHAADVARALGLRRIVVPAAPGILCAQGLVASDLRESFVDSGVIRVDDAGLPRIDRVVDELQQRAAAWFDAEAVAAGDRESMLSFDMRYVGQNYELAVATPALGGPDAEALRQAFFEVHERNYGYFNADDPVEIVNVRLTAVGRFERPTQPSSSGDPATPPIPMSERAVWFDADAAATTPVYDRSALLAGHRFGGPAVIEQMDSTTLLFPGDRCSVDAAGNLIIEVAP